jgi:hypothetical protein
LKRLPTELVFGLLITLAIIALVFLTWANYRYSLQNPGGSDFLPRWLGTRLFLMEGQSPYSEETTLEIQRQFYGRPARSGEDQVLFVYPFYSILLFSPFALIADYNFARAVWMTVLEVSVILLVAAGLSLNRWRLSPFMLGLIMLFAALWYYTVRALINANLALLISLVVALAFLAIRQERDGLAGLLLALTTVKPQMVILLILLVLLWSISNQRWILFWSLLGNIALLTAVTSLLIPNWIWQNLVQIFAYPDYTLPTTPGEIFAVWMPGVGLRLGYALTVIVAATLVFEWKQAWGKDFRWLLWTAGLTLAATQLIGLPTATENYMIMFPALLMVFASWEDQWRNLGKVLIYTSLILLFFGVWWLFLATLERGDQPIQGLIMFFPLPVFLLVGLYWVRWWVLRPEQPLLDRLRRSGRKQ